MRYSFLLFHGLLLGLTVSLAHSTVRAQSPATEETFAVEPTENLQLDYLQYLPEGYEESGEQRWPLVIFLHGSGERGDKLDAVKIHGPPMLAEKGREFPFILIAPQCPTGSWWSWEPMMPLIEHLELTLRIDADRIYLTGLSMGGYGTWALATRYPEKFAAIAPICGGGVPYLTTLIPKLPVWAFHGGKDKGVPLDESQRLIDALHRSGNSNAWLTIYPEAGHNSWIQAYATDTLYEWMLDQKRGAPGQTPASYIRATPAAANDAATDPK